MLRHVSSAATLRGPSEVRSVHYGRAFRLHFQLSIQDMKLVQSTEPFFACIRAKRFASKPSCCKFRELTVHIFSTHHVLCPWSCMRAIFCCPLSAMVLLFKNRELGAPASVYIHKSEREVQYLVHTRGSSVPAVVQHDVRVHYGSWRTKKCRRTVKNCTDSVTSFTDCKTTNDKL